MPTDTAPAAPKAEVAASAASAPLALPAPQAAVEATTQRRNRKAGMRFVLMVVLPLAAAVGGGALWLAGGRWISTDNSYVGAEKVLITPEVSGRVVRIDVTEGQKVRPGDPLFAIDPESYRLALAEAEAKLQSVRADHANLKTSVESLARQIVIAEESIELREKDLERKSSLLGNRVATQTDVETVRLALATARSQAESLKQSRVAALNQLLGDPALPIDRFPPYREALSKRDMAQRDLDNTVLRSPIAGMATQVPSIQMGRYLTAGTTVFAVVGTERLWVDANPKETDLEFVRPGLPVEITVDAYPGRVWHGTVDAISPGTGAQFSILPAQNASGNWVKVVQRVPVRVAFAPGEDTAGLRAGMSADVSIDTGRKRSLAGLVGLPAFAGGEGAPTSAAPTVR
ncbi:HlyD family secretion protein [Prosthecomicrobium hirschii]|uniref:HlyD family secretion protein n=1 Tax=Prosthecodimorpha hirschii TaxID=665126 RepID=UPI0022208DED|nr:HlyD family secretion protein [Prosthecomicrobium hirschii]MCW1844097.1 HlyD family secretion protein [Prosthecomicrobium hirschii]